MNTGNPAVAAALATVQTLEEEKPYEKMFDLGEKLRKGLKELADKTQQDLRVQGIGPIIHTGFGSLQQAWDYRDTLTLNKPKLSAFIGGLQELGIRVIGRGLWYLSTAHDEQDIEKALLAASTVLENMEHN